VPQLASHLTLVPASGIRRIFLLASGMDDVISLVVGEPDLPVAPHIGDAAKAAWDRDDTNYTANGGIPGLRSAIVEKLQRENDISVDTEQVWVTVGATQALHQAMGLTLDAGDEILIPNPGYTTFTMAPRMLGAVPVAYTIGPSTGFAPDFDELEQLVSPKTRVLLINSPSNPLGTVFSEDVLRRLLFFAKKHDLWVISDEVYEYFTWNEPHVSIASLDTDGRVFTAFSLSKTYAMTGIRVGYLVTPPGMAEQLRSVQEAVISCVNEPAQFAAIAAVTGSQQSVADAREHYRANIALATQVLTEKRLPYLEPRGTFYLWVDLSHASAGDVAAWAEQFLIEHRVAVAPGSAFGSAGEGWIRVCIAADPDHLAEGLSRLPGRAA
jgi:aspartate aminotransferase